MAIHIRADASARIGLGHAMRQLAVAEAATGRGLAVRLIGHVPEGVAAAYAGAGADLRPTDDGDWVEDVEAGDIVVFDGYAFRPGDYDAAARCGATVGVVSDGETGHYPVDVLLNQNLVGDLRAQTRPDTIRLVGPDYALIRRSFRARRRSRGEALGEIVVTMGGTDVAGLTGTVAAVACEELPGVEVTCVIGPVAPRPDVTGPRIQVERAPEDVAAVFDRSDAAVSAAGTTTWELLCMGLPAVLVQVADNQAHIGRPVGERGAALFAGEVPLNRDRLAACVRRLSDPDVRVGLSTAGRDLVDGRGAERFLDALLER